MKDIVAYSRYEHFCINSSGEAHQKSRTPLANEPGAQPSYWDGTYTDIRG